jgi:DNA-binding HxlR family transcriptional regulator
MNKRSYRQNCALALAGDVIGERWSLLLVRDLLVAPRRYKDLLQSLRGIGTNLLAARLKDLEVAGIIERTVLAPGAAAYQLTASGRALEPAVLSLVRWGLAYGPETVDGFHHRDDWDLLALKALFRPDKAGCLIETLQFHERQFVGWISIREQQASIGLGKAGDASIIVAAMVKKLFTTGGDVKKLVTSGSAAGLKKFMKAFSAPA